MNRNYSHPSESIPDRAYIHLEEISDFVKHTIHSTFTGSNIGAYCSSCHSLETRTTKKSHQSHVLIDGNALKGNILCSKIYFQGETVEETFLNFIIGCP